MCTFYTKLKFLIYTNRGVNLIEIWVVKNAQKVGQIKKWDTIEYKIFRNKKVNTAYLKNWGQ